ncbi:alpha/beta fold hydrolase [Phytomonospora endophytica]|uniref:Pimeloyl-ACP methyl ester carboxylesterase n=1 Tax=Phytomonospora endophytica TaxID=714109 RepID=A0A841FVL3_9ACTN|nr:alpha/beta hydrolase [Phytomonospora endophytica]MBB6037572.1 pimeloyl-ACP methyl ester carboxylesterase [Phytomonospora endophytica]GIG70273.1 alpha/beta hydrolase [Phytomonospora endophytica]
MPRVFVHGHPETAAIWEPLLAELDGPPPVLLSPPGYGAPVPDGFAATVTDYRDWLITELEAIGEPADLVGHDWGGGHVVNTVMVRPDLVRSWVSDVLGAFDADYEWHEYARREQRSDGPAVRFDPDFDTRVAILVQVGLGEPIARLIAEAQREPMAEVAHALYHSAAQPVMSDLGRDLELAAKRPGLSLLATEDHYVGTVEQRRRAGDRSGARTVTLEGLGHWWMVEDPARGARVLEEFWKGL